ncbi:MAG: aconitate hydratase AcnA [Thermoguttaceae bacterium]
MSLQSLSVNGKKYSYHSISDAGDVTRLPYSIRVLLESVMRAESRGIATANDVAHLAAWGNRQDDTKDDAKNDAPVVAREIPFCPSRVLLQDFTGVPLIVDLAAMRDAMKRLGGDPDKINPLIPVDLVIDHSVQTDFYGTPDAILKNVDVEFSRNSERYSLLRWAQDSLNNLRVIPPSIGIIHQVNLEYLASVVMTRDDGLLYPDIVVGTDSHTVMIGGLGVVGWGVGGIEAEAMMLGQPYAMTTPDVIGVELVGKLPAGVHATDLVLALTHVLRREGVVGKFVEFFGEGVTSMSVCDRAVVANMAPEYGATMGFFPVDDKTIAYLRETGRTPEHVAIVEAYCRANSLWSEPTAPIPHYTKILTFSLDEVPSAVAGPKRPQDHVPIQDVKESFQKLLSTPTKERGFGLTAEACDKVCPVVYTLQSDPADNRSAAETIPLTHGSVVIASITSCTNTSNPYLMVAAGLLARNAVKRQLETPRFVKTSLAPGSRVVKDYLVAAGLLEPLEQLGFSLVGYGCMTCIGNSGPLPESVAKTITAGDLVVASVISGNRNFEGRIHPLVKANYLASPAMVVAYALAGRVTIDFETEPLGADPDDAPIFLADIMPSDDEIRSIVETAQQPAMYTKRYSPPSGGRVASDLWRHVPYNASKLYHFDQKSTYIQAPPFLTQMTRDFEPPKAIESARALVVLGDSVTTDHISPAGSIKPDSPAGKYLIACGVDVPLFNSYGARRGNDQVMTRGTFANIRLRNHLVAPLEGGFTKHFPSNTDMTVYDAAMRYANECVPLIVLAGEEYGTGSSRDWAAKGTALLGVKAVIASSFERIHRSNLIGMGVLPLQFPAGASWQTLGLQGDELFSIDRVGPDFVIGGQVTVRAMRHISEGKTSETSFLANVRIDTPLELTYYINGGILHTVLRSM